MKTYIVFISLLTLAYSPLPKVAAQNASPDNSVVVTADKALEWDRGQSVFVARGNAKVTQNDTSIAAAKLTAAYNETNGGMNIETVTATGKTTIKNADTTGYGDGGFYNIANGYAELSGKRPYIETADATLTANNKIQYYINDNKMTAIGNVVLTRPGETLTADNVSVFFAPSNDGNSTKLQNAIATGNVTMKTDKETLYGNKADYKTDQGKVIVTGDVKIVQGPNVMTGDRAEFDMTTNTSTLSNEQESGRVRAVFYPGSK